MEKEREKIVSKFSHSFSQATTSTNNDNTTQLKNIARLIAKRWKALSHSERKPWDEAHERDRKRYVTENAAIGITIIVTPPEPRMMVDYQTPIDVLTRPNDISASDDPLAPARKKARNTRPNPKPSTRVRGEPN